MNSNAASLLDEAKILADITNELCEKHGCHTVILYGSRARGDATEASDYDILGVRDVGPSFRDARQWNGVFLDIFVFPKSKLESPQSYMLDMRHGRVLREKDKTAQNFFEKLETIYSEGPKKLASDEIAVLRTWHQKALVRIRMGGIHGNLRRFELMPALLEHFFTTRGEWYRGPKASFKWLNENRPDLYDAFEKAFEPSAPIQTIEDLVKKIDYEIENESKSSARRPTLKTKRLFLEPVTVDHATELYDLFADPLLHEFVPFEPPTFEEQLKRCERWEKDQSPDGSEIWLNWVARERGSGTAVGHFQSGIKKDGIASVGYVVARAAQGKGYAFEAMQEVLNVLRDSFGASQAKAWTDTRNVASHRLAKKLGMAVIETIKNADQFKGSSSDEFVFVKDLT